MISPTTGLRAGPVPLTLGVVGRNTNREDEGVLKEIEMVQSILNLIGLLASLLRDAANELPKEGLVAAASSAVTLVFQAGRKRWRTRRARAFWRPFLTDDLRIVIGRLDPPSEFELSGQVGYGDVRALDDLLAHLRSIGHTEPIVAYDDDLRGDELKRSIISLGGPDANSVTRDLADDVPSGVRFGNVERREISLYDSVERRSYSPRKGDDGCWTDYGLILRATNHRAPSKHIMIIAGSFGYGTWAGVRHVTSNEFLRSPLARDDAPTEVLVSTQVERGTPQKILQLLARRFEISSSRMPT